MNYLFEKQNFNDHIQLKKNILYVICVLYETETALLQLLSDETDTNKISFNSTSDRI